MFRRLGLGTNEEVVEGAIQQLNVKLDVYEGILGKQAYLAGEVSSTSYFLHVASFSASFVFHVVSVVVMNLASVLKVSNY